MDAKVIRLRWKGGCSSCGAVMERGARAVWKEAGQISHPVCPQKAEETASLDRDPKFITFCGDIGITVRSAQ